MSSGDYYLWIVHDKLKVAYIFFDFWANFGGENGRGHHALPQWSGSSDSTKRLAYLVDHLG